jgi:hypothetical protein
MDAFYGTPCGPPLQRWPPVQNAAVTFAVAVITPDDAAVAADSLLVSSDGESVASGRNKKVARGRAGIGVVAGLTGATGNSLNEALADALAAHTTPFDALAEFVPLAGARLRPYAEGLRNILRYGDTIFHGVVAGFTTSGMQVYRFEASLGGEDVVVVEPLDLVSDQATIVVLGASHPRGRRWDYRYGEFARTKNLTVSLTDRSSLAELPGPLSAPAPVDVEALARKIVTEMIDTEGLAARPLWWPHGVPVAAGPVMVERL